MSSVLLLFVALLSPFSITNAPDTTEANSLPPACQCEIPNFFKPRDVNKDTLRHFHDHEQYKKGLKFTLQFLQKDSTDRELIGWMGIFGHGFADRLARNPQYREKFYGKNPHKQYGSIQDTVAYIVYDIRKSHGPNLWSADIQRVAGRYALCSTRCDYTLHPNSRQAFSNYFHSLVLAKKFNKLDSLVLNHQLNPPKKSPRRDHLLGRWFMHLNKFFIGYKAYEPGLKYTQTILNNYTVPLSVKRRWNNIYHYAIRNDSWLKKEIKPHLHIKVEKRISIPETE